MGDSSRRRAVRTAAVGAVSGLLVGALLTLGARAALPDSPINQRLVSAGVALTDSGLSAHHTARWERQGTSIPGLAARGSAGVLHVTTDLEWHPTAATEDVLDLEELSVSVIAAADGSLLEPLPGRMGAEPGPLGVLSPQDTVLVNRSFHVPAGAAGPFLVELRVGSHSSRTELKVGSS